MSLEVCVRERWVPLAAQPQVRDDTDFRIRGYGRASDLTIGGIQLALDGPETAVRLLNVPDLQCHVGLLAIHVDGEFVGEIDVEPGRFTESAWRTLRGELESLWTGLIFDDSSPSKLSATGPDPVRLWAELAPAIVSLAASPPQTLGTRERLVRRERARSASELTVSVVLAGVRGHAGRARSIAPIDSEPERVLVRDCLQRLQALARRSPAGTGVAEMIGRYLSRPPFAEPSRIPVAVTHLARHEPRLRQVVAVRQTLLNSSLLLTEGPGDLRLGIKGLNRLYEYWVYLSVLSGLHEAFGGPVGTGFEQLATRLPGGRVRLELPKGISVAFPGGVKAAFEPTITQSGRSSWEGLELAGFPYQTGVESPPYVEPDIVVVGPGPSPTCVVIDAKYRARHSVDAALWDVHRKYSRIRSGGIGIVDTVLVAHPNPGAEIRWAGQRAASFIPGETLPEWIPNDWIARAQSSAIEDRSPPPDRAGDHVKDADPGRVRALANDVAASTPWESVVQDGPPAAVGTPLSIERLVAAAQPPKPRVDLVLCDQQWMAVTLGSRRIDFAELHKELAGRVPGYFIGSDLGNREATQRAARSKGWGISVANDRNAVMNAIADLCTQHSSKYVVVVSGDLSFIEMVRSCGADVEIVDDISWCYL